MEGNAVFLFAALVIVWVVIVGYLVMLSGRLTALQRELDALKRRDDWTDAREGRQVGAGRFGLAQPLAQRCHRALFELDYPPHDKDICRGGVNFR